jgi:GxxExxY protein
MISYYQKILVGAITDQSKKEEIDNDPLTEKIISACFNVHKKLGPGFNERIYQNALKIALEKLLLKYTSEKNFSVEYEGKLVGNFRSDIIVEDKVVVEIKALSGLIPKIFEYQLLSYLKISGLKVGLLVNFGNERCKVRRFVY